MQTHDRSTAPAEPIRSTAAAVVGGPILFYDGMCGLCDRAVQFVLRHDRRQRFRFAALQSEVARAVLARRGRVASALDTMYVLLDCGTPSERLLSRSDGVLEALRQLGGWWRIPALARVLPRALRDRAYAFIADRRYRWFGRHDQCTMPSPAVRVRFIDVPDTVWGVANAQPANKPVE
jgi:predicted DCC family thiol-disulfide oxidoreductase YuxK